MNRPFDFRKIFGGRFVNRPYEIDSSAVGATFGRPLWRKANQEAPSGRVIPHKMGKCLRSRQRGRGACLARNATEGESVPVKITVNLYLRILLPPLARSPFLPEEGYR